MCVSDLDERIEALRQDYAAVRGEPFKHFFCPILMRDECAEMCRAHIVNEALGAKLWLPQRKDVDSFYGSVAESDLVTVITERKKNLIEIMRDGKKSRRMLRPVILHEEREIEFYYPNPKAPRVPGQIRGKLLDPNDNLVCNLAIKMSQEELEASDGLGFSILIDADFRPAVTASMIKAAHLSLFNMLGYEYVFSPTGTYLGHILRAFFEKYRTPKNCSGEDVADYFHKFANMIVPVEQLGDSLKGTAVDGQLMSLFGQNDKVFAMGVIVRAGADAFCVFVPGMGQCIDTYFGFLNEPPPSVAVKITKYQPEKDGEPSCWHMPKGEARRVAIPPQHFDAWTRSREAIELA